ncbi:bactofilin family protein [Denitratisoma oestradiolicum]|uniref:Cell shape determination protein CcmA n=1 Tax=Denitratisoma oestradiolicum TaxID=311182 RepID=A0A6S6XXD9_9PROT|nr:polymer-forming cytoskeletal protein [Denitratisoma oestradiolicum]TWO79753.1 cell shape determination protein CcmA [Denitratisoma oestradiolicum]CAB1367519.1 Cell shape determination protein CcmA [Denitratisoma oestradiolicum]
MFSKRQANVRIESLIGAGTKVEGNIHFSGGLRVDGEVCGNVFAIGDTPSTLVISERARIEGEIRVSHLVVNGTVVGPIMCGDFLELQSQARVTGDVEYGAIEMRLGAIVEGRLVHRGSAGKAVELKLASAN